jgi:hypothetical protein
MAGYLFLLDSLASLERYVLNGVYGTKINRPGTYWGASHLFTLADYLTMRPGDLVFFFIQRKIYGVGRLISLDPALPPALCNYPDSFLPRPASISPVLWDEGDGADRPWVCFFEPDPAFLRDGLDMDDVLEADVKGVAQALRVLERVSFIQMDDDEADLLSDLFVRKSAGGNALLFPDNHLQYHSHARQVQASSLLVDVDRLIGFYANGDGTVRSEAALEAWLVGHLRQGTTPGRTIFGSPDYITHQFPASPLKPVMYMDRIDVLTVETTPSPGTRGRTAIRNNIIEIKRDGVSAAVGQQTVNQLMKYVDWLAARRGGYENIAAFLVASDFSPDVIQYCQDWAVRDYVVQRRPFLARRWNNIHLVAYNMNSSQSTRLNLVYDGTQTPQRP